eukprot:Skav203868  [mRNA]  locus=scaffold1031:152796:155849:- [translate_table: standard]
MEVKKSHFRVISGHLSGLRNLCVDWDLGVALSSAWDGVIDKAQVANVVNADPSALDISGFTSALAGEEAKSDSKDENDQIISTSCGFMIYFQESFAKFTKKTFISSSLVALPDLRSRYADHEIMILTFDAAVLSALAYKEALGNFAGPVIGLEKWMHLYEVISKDLEYLDVQRAELEMDELMITVLQRGPIKAMVLECTNLPPYKHIIRRHFTGEIIDCLSVLEASSPGLVKEEHL